MQLHLPCLSWMLFSMHVQLSKLRDFLYLVQLQFWSISELFHIMFGEDGILKTTPHPQYILFIWHKSWGSYATYTMRPLISGAYFCGLVNFQGLLEPLPALKLCRTGARKEVRKPSSGLLPKSSGTPLTLVCHEGETHPQKNHPPK